MDPRFLVRTALADRRPLLTILFSLVRTPFILCRPDLWKQVSLVRTAIAIRPTIHHITFHLGRHAFAVFPTRIVSPRSLVRTANSTRGEEGRSGTREWVKRTMFPALRLIQALIRAESSKTAARLRQDLFEFLLDIREWA